MCIMSIVHDHYRDEFNKLPPFGGAGMFPWSTTPVITTSPSKEEIDRMEKVIADFREAQAAAVKLDAMMKQPDCVDPEKAKLQERVAELEAQIEAVRAALKSTHKETKHD